MDQSTVNNSSASVHVQLSWTSLSIVTQLCNIARLSEEHINENDRSFRSVAKSCFNSFCPALAQGTSRARFLKINSRNPQAPWRKICGYISCRGVILRYERKKKSSLISTFPFKKILLVQNCWGMLCYLALCTSELCVSSEHEKLSKSPACLWLGAPTRSDNTSSQGVNF